MANILNVVDVLDKHDIAWSYMGEVIFVGKDRTNKIREIVPELSKIKGVKQGYDKEGNYIAFDKLKKTEIPRRS